MLTSLYDTVLEELGEFILSVKFDFHAIKR